MVSDYPLVAQTRHHPIVMFRLPGRVAGIAMLVLLLWSWFAPAMVLVLLAVLGAAMFVRWQVWAAENIIVTQWRILRVQGVPETTTAEAFLRIDRISGMRVVQSVPGKILGYGTIELEAPGNHPDVRRLVKIPQPHDLYVTLRDLVHGGGGPPTRGAGPAGRGDPDDVGSPATDMTGRLGRAVGSGRRDHTEPLPRVDPDPLRKPRPL